MGTRFDKYIGVLITALAIAVLGSTAIDYKVSTITSIFGMLIVFSIYMGGILPGVGSTIVTILYMYYLRAIHPRMSDFNLISNNEFMLNIMSMLCIVIIAAIIDYKYRSYYERFKENDAYITRAKEISEVMICHSTIDGILTKVPPKLCSLLEYNADEILGMFSWDIMYTEDISREQKLTDDIIKGNIETFNMEKRLHKKGGEIVWVFCNVSAVKNDDGEIIYLLRYLLDITQQKRMEEEIKNKEEELRRSENKYRSLVELDPDAVIIHEGDRISFINNAGKNMLGASEAKEIIGENIYEFIHPDYIYNVKTQIGRARINLNHPGIPFELKIVCQDSKEIDVEAINVGFCDGNDNQVMVIIRDITERKKSEELQTAMKENERRLAEAKEYDRIKNEFFANISHELRTPLNVILGTLQLLNIHNKNKSNYNSDKYLAIMKQNCYRLLRLVNNLIDITKIDAGYFDINIGCYDIVRIIEDITLSVADYTQEKCISLVFDTNVEEKIISCDPNQMERIMLNLISNAIKFTNTGGRIFVNLSHEGGSIIISVKDTGIGIPEDRQDMIFDRFVQVNKSLTRDHEGSGIGLSLVKSLVEMQGGTISLISKPGCGSEFIIEFPIDEIAICYKEESDKIEAKHAERIEVEFSDIYS